MIQDGDYYVVMAPLSMVYKLFKYMEAHTELSWVGNHESLTEGRSSMFSLVHDYTNDGGVKISIYNDDLFGGCTPALLYGSSEIHDDIEIGINSMFDRRIYDEMGVPWHD